MRYFLFIVGSYKQDDVGNDENSLLDTPTVTSHHRDNYMQSRQHLLQANFLLYNKFSTLMKRHWISFPGA